MKESDLLDPEQERPHTNAENASKTLSSQPSGNKLVKWNDIELHPPSSKIMSNPTKVWQLGGFPKENGKLNTEKNNMQFVWKKDTISNKSRDLKASFETSS